MIGIFLIIISVVFFAMAFFTLGFVIGRSGNKEKIIIAGTNIEDSLTPAGKEEYKRTGELPKETMLRNYPKNGIRSTFTIEEPSGPVYRPTAAELRKMEEDEITRVNKDAVAEVFKNEEPPVPSI